MKTKFPVWALKNWVQNWYRSGLRHPKYRWWVILGSLLYLFGPLDISPDVVPIVGWLDDGLIATLLITEVSQFLVDRRQAQKEQQAMMQTSVNAAEAIVDVEAVTVR